MPYNFCIMLKWLAVVAMFLAVAQTALPVPGQTANQSHPTSNKHENNPQGSKNPSAPTVAPVAKKDGAPAQEDRPAPDSSNGDCAPVNITDVAPMSEVWSWHDKVAWGGNLILLGLGLGTLCWLRIQTIATKKAAEAALTNAKAVINSERPWLSVLPQYREEAPELPAISVINKGRTPAKLICRSEKQIQLRENMPEVPVYGQLHMWPDQDIILNGESTEICMAILERDVRAACGSDVAFQMVKNWTDAVYVFGVVYYQDILNTSDPITYETRWCCRYFPGDQGVRLKVFGPPGYNAHT